MIVDGTQKDLFDGLRRRVVPTMGHLHLTERCNLRCEHCYRIGLPWGNELSTDEWKRILREMKEEGCMDITFSGGEPLLHPGFREIITETRRLRFEFEILQNGTVITESDIDFLRENMVRELSFSIHGIGEVHDKFVKMKGAYDHAIQMLRYAAGAGLRKVVVRMSVLQQTFGSVDALAAICRELKVVFAPSYFMIPRFSPGDDGFLDNRLTDAQIQEFERRSREWTGREEFSKCVDDEYPNMCNMGWSRFAIGPQGHLFPCVQVPEAVDNIRFKPFKDGWRYSKRMNEIRAQAGEEIEECASCGNNKRCKYKCMGHFKQATGHYDQPPEDHCRIVEAWVAMDDIIVERKTA